LIFLHGWYPGLDAGNWKELMVSAALINFCEENGLVLLMPFGRGNVEFMGPGEDDVLRTLGFVREEYHIDPDHVVLCGASMGGSGALAIACHRPHEFAALVLLTARVDYYLWQGIEPERLPPHKRACINADYGRHLLPNIRHVPVLSFHGGRDEEFAAQAARLKELAAGHGVTADFVVIEEGAHGIWASCFEHPKFKEAVRSARRVAAPRNVALRTYTLKHPRAYWLSVTGIDTYGRVAKADVHVSGDVVTITAENVSGLTLGPAVPGIGPEEELTTRLNGRTLKLRSDATGRIAVPLDEAPDGGIAKNAKQPGRIRDAFSRPFLIVYPGGDDPEARKARSQAERFAEAWHAYAHGVPPRVSTKAFTPMQMVQRNLVLFGTPQTNPLLRDITARLPVRIKNGRYHVGERRIAAEGNGLICIYPNPMSAGRYVLLMHGAEYGPDLPPNHKFDFLPDFIIFRKGTRPDNTMFPTNETLCAGFFNDRWELSEASTWFNEEALRAMEAEPAPAALQPRPPSRDPRPILLDTPCRPGL
jgi:dienelactone hydrolase